ncbi:hypothetical protein LJR239_006161 [Neorhizobium tomejilense]
MSAFLVLSRRGQQPKRHLDGKININFIGYSFASHVQSQGDFRFESLQGDRAARGMLALYSNWLTRELRLDWGKPRLHA